MGRAEDSGLYSPILLELYIPVQIYARDGAIAPIAGRCCWLVPACGLNSSRVELA